MDEPDAPATPPAEPRRRGRRPSGKAKTSTERNDARRERLRQSGGRLLSTVMLGPVAAAALAELTAGGRTIDQEISAALVERLAALRARGGADPAPSSFPPAGRS